MSLLTPMMRTSPLTAWFSDAQRVQGMLDFEAALRYATGSLFPHQPTEASCSTANRLWPF